MQAVIIAGPRDLYPSHKDIRDALHFSNFRPIDTIISGAAKGVDTVALEYARVHGYVPVAVSPRWNWWRLRGSMRLAGHERNGFMLDINPKGVILMKRWGLETPGTTNMQKQANVRSVPVFEWRL